MQALGLDSVIVDDSDNAQAVLSQERVVRKLTGGVDISAEEYATYVKSNCVLARAFKLKKGDQAVIINGRVCFSTFSVNTCCVLIGWSTIIGRGPHRSWRTFSG